MSVERVHIIGSAGSGKTTLAREYARIKGIPHHELDNMMWADVAARRPRPTAERDLLLQQSIAPERWVTEGIFWQKWVSPLFERADKIIVLDIPARTLHYRVVKRHFKLLLAAERESYHLFLPTLIELIKLNRNYKTGPLKWTMKALSTFMEKVVVCATNEKAMLELCIEV